VIIIFARSRPSETVASHVLKGFLDKLLAQSPSTSQQSAASLLRNNYLFIIIPMLNIDGVSLGNSRACLSGLEFDRSWKDPDRMYSPEAFYIKKLIASIKSTHEIACFFEIRAAVRSFRSHVRGTDGKHIGQPVARQVNPREIALLFGEWIVGFSIQECKYSFAQTASL
jgi:hypothetical protein